MSWIIDVFAAVPQRIIGAAVFAWDHPAYTAAAGIVAVAVAAAFAISVRSWRKEY